MPFSRTHALSHAHARAPLERATVAGFQSSTLVPVFSLHWAAGRVSRRLLTLSPFLSRVSWCLPPQAATQFKASLAKLMEILMSKEPSYVRCIKPNDSKQAGMKSFFSTVSCSSTMLHSVSKKGSLSCNVNIIHVSHVSPEDEHA